MTDAVIFAPSLADAFDRAGLPFPGEPQPGALTRFQTDEKDRTDRAGWLRVFPDADGAVFGCWRGGTRWTWQKREQNAPPPLPSEIETMRAKAAHAQREAEAERQKMHAEARATARQMLSEGTHTDAHPYLTRKGLTGVSVRVHADGRLLLPVLDKAGEVQSLQSIHPNGTKRFLSGGQMAGGRLYLGTPKDGQPLVLCEGYATGLSLRQSSALPVVVCFSGSNMAQVAKDMRASYPHSPVTVAADRDAHGRGAEYAEAAKIACAPSRVVLPVFADGRAAGDFDDLRQAEGLDAVRVQITGGMASRFRLLTASDLAALPPLRWLVRGVLPEQGIAAIFGPSGSGKSFLVLDLLGAIASGAQWFGHRVESVPVLYVAAEGEAGISQRVGAWQMRNEQTAEGFRFLLSGLDIRSAEDRADLVQAIRAEGWAGGVLVLDTLNRCAPGIDENSSQDMGEAIAACKAIQAELGGLVLLVHHAGKDASKGMRGHSSLLAALDAAVEVTRDGDRREWRLHKSKDGADGDTHPFRLSVVEIGEDDEGEPITSCIVVPEQKAADAVRRVLPPKSGNQSIVWDALGDMLKESKDFGKAGAQATRPCVRLEDAIEKIRGRLPVEEKRKTERTQAALTGLVSRGAVRCSDGWLWCA